jgi:hypothetical protein
MCKFTLFFYQIYQHYYLCSASRLIADIFRGKSGHRRAAQRVTPVIFLIGKVQQKVSTGNAVVESCKLCVVKRQVNLQFKIARFM